ncbi:MAG TPA: protein tyrosine phosphatase [Terriglobia bacterium]|nr:protein tyrosine phosphatase [Terriglobia bacterium]
MSRSYNPAAMILVCPLSKVSETISTHKPLRVISILDPGWAFPELGPTYVGRHLCLEFHDIHLPTLDRTMPAAAHVDRLLRFLNRWDPRDSLLIHCRAGIGRSTAAAFIAACYHNPGTDEQEIAAVLRKASPIARPNKTLIRIADNAMNRKGLMLAAMESALRDVPFADASEAEPFQIPSIYPGR